jgi:predicted RecB family nuclease
VSYWESQLEEFNSINKQLTEKKQEGQLRFNRKVVRVSDVADQYYCEKKVEMRYTFGRIENYEMTRGSQWHERLLDNMEKIKFKDIWKKIYEPNPLYVSEIPLLTRYRDIIIAGVPDAIFFTSGVPFFLLEYKFTRSTSPSVSNRVQVGTYGLLLNKIGFNTDHLFHAIVLVDPSLRTASNLRQNIFRSIIKNGLKQAVLKTENAIIYTDRFDKEQAKKDLEWAIKYWQIQREATPTEDQNKCERCEYRFNCKVDFLSDSLTALPLVGFSRARAFEKMGIGSVEQVSKIEPLDNQFRNYPCFTPGVLALIKNYAIAINQNKIIIKRKEQLLKNEKIYFVDLEYDPAGTRSGPYGIFIIGILDQNGKAIQHFVNDPCDEGKILQDFINWYREEKPTLVAYASTSADRPQLINALSRFGIATQGIEHAFFDLYLDCINTQRIDAQNIFLPMRGSMGLKEVSKTLGYKEPTGLRISDGLQALFMYARYLSTKDENIKVDLLQYNLVDLERTKFVFDKVREELERAKEEEPIILETNQPKSISKLPVAINNLVDYTCPKCRYFHSSKYLNKSRPKRCFRCGYLFTS